MILSEAINYGSRCDDLRRPNAQSFPADSVPQDFIVSDLAAWEAQLTSDNTHLSIVSKPTHSQLQ